MNNLGVIAMLFICGLLACLTKKAGIYVVVPTLLLMFLIHVSKKAKAISFAIGAVIAIIMMVLIPKFVLPTLGIESGASRKASRLLFSRWLMISSTTAAI